MNAPTARDAIRELAGRFGFELHSDTPNQLHFLIDAKQPLLELSHRLREEDCYLVTVVATDERELEDHSFKLYYVFSHPTENLFLIVENVLGPGAEAYPSLYAEFAAVEPFECEIADLFGLYPDQPSDRGRVARHAYLHECYPPDLHPLRRDCTRQVIEAALAAFEARPQSQTGPAPRLATREGEVLVPVGPVHAGVIEPGHFCFCIGGETVEELDIRLGYAHKGIERLFQTGYTLHDGWQLAERVSGDSAFAHSLAYCQAAEALALAHAPPEAAWLRGLFLELERMVNHIGDTGALAHDVALEMFAAELAVLREEMMRLNHRLAGHRFLRGLNRPGGVVLPAPLPVADVRQTVDRVTDRYLVLAQSLVKLPDFRERTIDIGTLSEEQARQIGVTGLAARAAGLDRDFRIQHPFGPYSGGPGDLLREERQGGTSPATAYLTREGDVFNRFLMRLQEVGSSARLVRHFLDLCAALPRERDFVDPVDFAGVPNFEFGLGYVEGWRGDIVYWLMKDKHERIFRCQARSPSILNWPGLKAAVEPYRVGERWVETAIADFPIINKSFNLSYSGNDR